MIISKRLGCCTGKRVGGYGDIGTDIFQVIMQPLNMIMQGQQAGVAKQQAAAQAAAAQAAAQASSTKWAVIAGVAGIAVLGGVAVALKKK